jgi:hypothetical protein
MANNAPVSREGVTNVVPTHVVTVIKLVHCTILYAMCSVGEILKMGIDGFERFSCYILHTDTSLAVMNGFWLTFAHNKCHYHTW